MGKYFQLIRLMTADEMPTAKQIAHHYSALHISDDVKRIRREFQKQFKKQEVPEELGWRAAEYFLYTGTLDLFNETYPFIRSTYHQGKP